MKKLAILGVLILVMFGAWAQEVVFTNQVTVAWDPVLETGAVSYEVFVCPSAAADRDVEKDFVEETLLTESTVNFPDEGLYVVGVRTKKVIDGQTLYSEVNWSDVDGASTPDPFVVASYRIPVAPANLRRLP